MQHDCIHYKLEGLNGLEGEGADFKRGRGRTDSVLAHKREKCTREKELFWVQDTYIAPMLNY